MIISKSLLKSHFLEYFSSEEWFIKKGGAFLSLAFQKYSYSVVKRLPKLRQKIPCAMENKRNDNDLNKIKQPIVREYRFYNFLKI